MDRQDPVILCCRNEIQKLFCLGYRKWKILTEDIKSPILKKHKNIGNNNASFNYKSEVLDYFSGVSHNYGRAQATQFVRELTGIVVRDLSGMVSYYLLFTARAEHIRNIVGATVHIEGKI